MADKRNIFTGVKEPESGSNHDEPDGAGAIDSSFQALSEHNTELADKIIKGDRDVDNMERKIETHCLMLMLKQQPVASDLRHISTALKVVTDLEPDGRSGSGYCRSVPALRGSGLRSCEQTPSGDGGKCKNDG